MSFKCFNRVQAAIFFTVCFCLLIIQTKTCVERFLKHETGVTISIQSTTANTFPSFTICADYNSSYKEDFLESYNTSSTEFRAGIMPATINNISLLDFFRKATRNLTELLDHVSINCLNSSDTITPGNTTVWTEQLSITLGRCYTLTPPLGDVGKEILTVEFFLINWPAYVYTHHPGQYLDPDTHSKIVTALGQRIYIDIDFELTYLLQDIEGNTNSLVCQNDMNFGYDQCVLNKRAELQIAEFNCSGIFDPEVNRTCDIPRRFNSSEQQYFVKRQKILGGTCCTSPCAGLSYTFGLPDLEYDELKNASYIEMYFMKNVKVTNLVYTYDALTLVADLGAYSGLLLGFSIYKISIWLEKAISAFCVAKIHSEGRKKWRKIAELSHGK